jgi:hypothetical protein
MPDMKALRVAPRRDHGSPRLRGKGPEPCCASPAAALPLERAGPADIGASLVKAERRAPQPALDADWVSPVSEITHVRGSVVGRTVRTKITQIGHAAISKE